jgi:hypothetical protein
MKRVIVDYQKLNNEILELLVAKYPDGYDDYDTISFKNAQNELVECVEVKTEDTLYLVKISKRLVTAMADFENDDDDSDDENSDGDDEIKDIDSLEKEDDY